MVLLQNIWDAGDSLITQLELNKNRNLWFYDNKLNNGDWCITHITPKVKQSPVYRLSAMSKFFFIEVSETHKIVRQSGIIPDKAVYNQFTDKRTRKLYGINHRGLLEDIIEFGEDSSIRLIASDD